MCQIHFSAPLNRAGKDDQGKFRGDCKISLDSLIQPRSITWYQYPATAICNGQRGKPSLQQNQNTPLKTKPEVLRWGPTSAMAQLMKKQPVLGHSKCNPC